MNKKIVFLSACLLAGSVAFTAETALETKIVQHDAAAIEQAIKLFDSGERAEAYVLLKALENSGDVRILSRLGWCYFSGNGVEKNHDLAYQCFSRSMDDPDGFGVDGMGVCYQLGIGVKKDLAKAEELYKKALTMGNLYAAGNLAMYYSYLGNNAEAIRYWEMTYNSQLPPDRKAFSAHMLGLLQADPKQKVSWWEKSAQLGYHESLIELARLYNFGGPVEINMPKALEYARMYAERTGDHGPYASIAFDWAVEKMVLREFNEAEKYMLIAADNGIQNAYWYAFLLSGNGKYALMAAESGDERGFAEAGVYLMNRRKDNPQLAEEYRERAINYYIVAIKIQDSNSLNALCNLAAAYAEKNDAENIERSLELNLEAASWYFARGLRGSGLIYSMLSRMEVNEEAKKKYALGALEYMASAVFAGDEFAAEYYETLSPLADKYNDSAEAAFFKGVKLITFTSPDNADDKLFNEAVSLIKSAADAGCTQAIMMMGICLMNGVIFEQNNNAAVQYLSLAAKQGNLHAKWLLSSSPQFAGIVPESDIMNYLKELIAVGNKNAHNLYAQLLHAQGKTAEAIKECRAAAADGHAGSMTLLHLLLMLNQNDERAMKEAWDILGQAAMEKQDGLAQCVMGMNCLENPNFAPRFGMHLLLKGIVDGNGMSGYYLHCIAMNYAQGTGVARSAENARRIAEIMLEDGNAYGFYTLGVLCQNGVFGQENIAQACEYFRQGAELGVPECIEALGSLPAAR